MRGEVVRGEVVRGEVRGEVEVVRGEVREVAEVVISIRILEAEAPGKNGTGMAYAAVGGGTGWPPGGQKPGPIAHVGPAASLV